ncbi:hypothetical protein OG423_05775 [Micromonospora zamorensis]|uniref:hypothetical protein n=1 Tax=Micromonospora zamorensis TaxID=709883 RepID=UPI00352B3308|nr:hypothetical protein OG423_05775 [Micromonospora zamorensis]
MYDETGPDGRRLHTVAQIAAEFGVTRPTIHRQPKHWADTERRQPRRSPAIGTPDQNCIHLSNEEV